MKIAFSGTQGTGKTTALYKLAYEMKLEYPLSHVVVISEVARNSPFPINQQATMEGQQWIFDEQVRRENQYELNHKYVDNIVICDRTVLDCVAYTKYNDLEWIPMFMESIQHMATYDTIYFQCRKLNPYNFSDGLRAIDETFRRRIEVSLMNLYEELIDNYIPDLNLLCKQGVCGKDERCF